MMNAEFRMSETIISAAMVSITYLNLDSPLECLLSREAFVAYQTSELLEWSMCFTNVAFHICPRCVFYTATCDRTGDLFP
jgi:hypothetical protein